MGPLREYCFEGKLILWIFPVVVGIYAVQIFSSFGRSVLKQKWLIYESVIWQQQLWLFHLPNITIDLISFGGISFINVEKISVAFSKFFVVYGLPMLFSAGKPWQWCRENSLCHRWDWENGTLQPGFYSSCSSNTVWLRDCGSWNYSNT